MTTDFQRPRNMADLLERYRDRVQPVLNMLLESSCFYQQDHPDSFSFLSHYRHEFARFFNDHFGWELIVDAKCARLYKPQWYNDAVPPSSRELFNFTKRDECIAFMLLLEFFEHKLETESITVDEENLRFRFGELLRYTVQRFQELYPQNKADYAEENVRARIVRPIMPQLEKHRFLKKIPPPRDELIGESDTIYEALPALYHYNVARLAQPLGAEEAPNPETEETES